MVWYGCISATMPRRAWRAAVSGPLMTWLWMMAKRRSSRGPFTRATSSKMSRMASTASSPMAWTRGLKPAESAPKTRARMFPSGMYPEPWPVTYPVLVASRQFPRTPVVR